MFDQFSKSSLIVAFALTLPIKPLGKQLSQLIFKAAEASPVSNWSFSSSLELILYLMAGMVESR
jgi:hypothetical protein